MNDMGFQSHSSAGEQPEDFDRELLRHDICLSHQWQQYPESIAEVAQQLQNDILGKHQKLEKAIKAILAKCLPPPGQPTTPPIGPSSASATTNASYVHERPMQLGHATAALESFCATQTMQTAILAE